MKRILTLWVALTATISAFASELSEQQLPLYIVNGEALSIDEVKNIDATEIESMTVLRTDDQVATYKHLGDTSNGVVVIALKRIENEIPFTSVETMPTFMGGNISSFRNWVMQNLRYPSEAIEKNLQDFVLVQFVVNREGYIDVDDITVLQSKYPDIFMVEVKRILSTSPRWTPGIQRGEAVPVMFTLPITFQMPTDNQKGEVAIDSPKYTFDDEPIDGIVIQNFSAMGGNTEQEGEVVTDSPKYIFDDEPIEGIVIQNFSVIGGNTEGDKMLYIVDGVKVSPEEFWNIPEGECKQVAIYKRGDKLEYYKHFGDVSNGVVVIYTVSPEVEPDPDVLPSFMNSNIDGFMQWIYQNIRYPNELKEENISAKVSATFIVNDKGYIEVKNIMTYQGAPHPMLHAEIKRVLLSSPQWQPATKDGKAVAYRVTIPITFGSAE